MAPLARFGTNLECASSAAAFPSIVAQQCCPASPPSNPWRQFSSGTQPSAASQQEQQQQRWRQPPQSELQQLEENAGAELQLSEAAVARLRQLEAQSTGAPPLLRVLVEGGGCSGFQYQFSLDETGPGEGDRVFTRDGVAVVCDEVSLEFLRGATVDYESDLMRSAFVVQENPNAAASCGCGSSFAAK